MCGYGHCADRNPAACPVIGAARQARGKRMPSRLIVVAGTVGQADVGNGTVWNRESSVGRGSSAFRHNRRRSPVHDGTDSHLVHSRREARGKPATPAGTRERGRGPGEPAGFGWLRHASHRDRQAGRRGMARIPCLHPADRSWTGYPTQKSTAPHSRIVRAGSNEGDMILNPFCVTDRPGNLQRPCSGCSRSKGGKTLAERRATP